MSVDHKDLTRVLRVNVATCSTDTPVCVRRDSREKIVREVRKKDRER